MIRQREVCPEDEMAVINSWRSMAVGIVVGILMTAGIVLWARPATQDTHGNQQFDTVSAHTLRIVDEQGHPRFVIGAPLPNPVVQGKELPRSSPVVGIQFLDKDGNETGGLAIIDRMQGAALCFDYSGGEAMCFTKARDYKGITLLDPPAAGRPAWRSGEFARGTEPRQGNAAPCFVGQEWQGPFGIDDR